MLRKYIAPMIVLAVTAFASAVPAFARFEPVTCKNSFSQEQEIAEGNKVALQVYQQMPVLPDSDPVARYVQALGARLVQQAPVVPGVERQWPYNFHVVSSPEINAFALPGGSIFVNLGTIQAAENESQLAGVMAHEISHVAMRHSTCNLIKQQHKGLLYGLGALGAGILLGDGTAGQLAQTGLGLGQSLTFLKMSRGDEEQADLLGVNILNQSSYDPRGLPQFFEIIRSKYGAGGSQFLSDHPNPGNRTEYVNAEIATLPRNANATVNTQNFTASHRIAMNRTALTAAEVKNGTWKNSGQYASAPGSQTTVPVSTTYNPGNTPSYPPATQSYPPAAQVATIAPIAVRGLGIRDRVRRFTLPGVSLSAPSTWQQTSDAQGNTILSPSGGSGSFGVAYGVLVSTVRPADGPGNGDALNAATDAVIRIYTQQNGLTRTSAVNPITVSRQDANAVLFDGKSPVAFNGQQAVEKDTLVTVLRRDGDLLTLTFVSPAGDYAKLKPVFDRILASVSLQ